MAIKQSEIGIDIAVYSIAVMVFVITLYPILFVFFMSVSTPESLFANKVMFLPDAIYLKSYKEILQEQEIWRYYYNTIWIVVIGTSLNLILTLATGYVLSRKDFRFRNIVMIFVVFTMFFGGGLIPFYICVRRLGLIGSRWSQVLPFALAAWNIIICRTYLKSAIPEELHEASIVDGCSKLQILYHVIIPLSKPVMAVIALWVGVSLWNSYFWALVFLPDLAKQPIQVFLVNALIRDSVQELERLIQFSGGVERMAVVMQLKYCVIILATLPILMLFPFLQKYFVRGVIIGSLK